MGEAILSVSAANAGETALPTTSASTASNPRLLIAPLLLLLLCGRFAIGYRTGTAVPIVDFGDYQITRLRG
jgi:hypothetical protein